MIKDVIIAVLSAALVAAVTWALWLSWGKGSLEAENVVLRLDIGACGARLLNMQEDARDDASVLDPDFTVPDHWLLPPSGADTQ